MVLMFNLGWTLPEIGIHYGLEIAVVKLMIVTHLKAERLKERLLASAQS